MKKATTPYDFSKYTVRIFSKNLLIIYLKNFICYMYIIK